MKITPFFRWYDLWIGAYIDKPERTIYICPLPTIGIKISFLQKASLQPPRKTCYACDSPVNTPHAHWLGEWEGWHVSWDCVNECGNELEMDWPFPDKLLVTAVDFEQAGFRVS